MGVRGGRSLLDPSAPTEHSTPRYWQFWQAHIGPRNAHGSQHSLLVELHNKIVQETGRSHQKSPKSKCTCNWTRKHKRLKLGGSQAYDHSSD
jgi:hypothetical protein